MEVNGCREGLWEGGRMEVNVIPVENVKSYVYFEFVYFCDHNSVRMS